MNLDFNEFVEGRIDEKVYFYNHPDKTEFINKKIKVYI